MRTSRFQMLESEPTASFRAQSRSDADFFPFVRPSSCLLYTSREQVLEKLNDLAEAGVTEFSAAMAGGADDRDATYDTLVAYQSM